MRIGLVVYPNCMVSGLFAFAEILGAGNKRMGKKVFELKWVSFDLSPLNLFTGRSSLSVTITPQINLLDDNLDAILLPGFWTQSSQECEKLIESNQLLLDILKRYDRNKSLWAYCTAVALVAKTGRLKDCDATATWWLADYLQNSFKDINWRFNKTTVLHGRNATASGVNGYLSIAQHLIKTYCNERVLRDVNDLMVIPRPETDLQPFKAINLMTMKEELTKNIYMWVENTPAIEISLQKLSQTLHLTERTLARTVKKATGLSCAKFMRLVKLHQAGEMLIYGSESINRISDRLGYSDDASFRRTFKKVTTYAPSQYRQIFKR